MVRVWVDGSALHSRLEYKPGKFGAPEMDGVAKSFGTMLALFADGESQV